MSPSHRYALRIGLMRTDEYLAECMTRVFTWTSHCEEGHKEEKESILMRSGACALRVGFVLLGVGLCVAIS